MAACSAAGVDIPRFCYHQRLSIAGNCRMCLVEVEKSPKPVASCAMPAGPGMNIKTDTPLVKKAREGVMEFLLINHPLDCPICDQGGECDLQDQSMHFGSDRGRFTEMKRSVQDKNLGPLVKTVMTRCIHCTRCVRFATEVAGVQDLGMTGRGNASEIGTYVEKAMQSELSGNVIDLCPVGALTSKPYAFTARNWELKSTESVDVSDAMGQNIRVDSRGVEVMRIVPVQNDAVNEEWISDKARFQYDGLKRQRLNVPLVKGSKGLLESATWEEALVAAKDAISKVKGNEMSFIAGKLADAESLIALKDLANRLGSGNLKVEAGAPHLDADVRSNYLANSTISGIDRADVILLIGSNPRVEAPVFNARIRKTFLDGAHVAMVGEEADLTFPVEYLGTGPDALAAILKGSPMLKRLKEAQRPAIIVGPGVLNRPDSAAVLQQVHELVEKADVVKEGWNGYNVLHDSASRVAALDIGFMPSARSASAPAPKLVYLLGSDDFDPADVPADAFVIYQGHHGDKGAARANIVLPGAAYTEKNATYVNFEGRTQRTKAAVPRVGDARSDWSIIRALSEVLEKPLPYDTTDEVRARLAEVAPHFAQVDTVQSPMWLNGEYFKAFKDRAGKVAVEKQAFSSSISNFFQTDVISRTSINMAKCVQTRASLAHK
ncbi:NADH dehydrogenase [ubiquinone] iron-sulfur protein 1, mitochondrial [Coccomyxa sp. Obi]|nr:NADH dehydrogenase [ubiquinone] iron-sulfur protein 1, mitochondrial [Coccomyxa sp. Obi]